MANNTPAPVTTPSSTLTDDLFASDLVIEREVDLPDGKKHTLYFRELTAAEFKQHLSTEQSKDPKIRNSAPARLIARSLVEPDGRRALSAERAAKLKPAVSAAMFMAIMEINGVLARRAAAEPAPASDDDGLDDLGDLEEGDQGN